MKRAFLSIISICLFLGLNNITSFAANSYKTETNNSFSIGNVDISLDEYIINENGERVDNISNVSVVPGEKVKKVLEIKNNANKAYVRGKIEISSILSEDNIAINNAFVKCGDYYYLKDALDNGESVAFINEYTMPADITANTFNVDVTVDAIQEANFTPDYNADDPWFGVKIEKSINAGISDTTTGNKQFELIFKNDSKDVVNIDENLFGNLAYLMPGDSISDGFTLTNGTNKQMEITLDSSITGASELIKKLSIIIKDEENTLYDDLLSNLTSINFGKLAKNDSKKVTFTVNIPTELTNDYSLMNVNLKWVFDTKSSSSGSGGSGGGGGAPYITPNINGNNNNNDGNNTTNNNGNNYDYSKETNNYEKGITDKDGKLKEKIYDENGNLIDEVYDKYGNRIYEIYDKDGNLIDTIYDENGNLRSPIYDKDGNLIDGLYDKYGNPIPKHKISKSLIDNLLKKLSDTGEHQKTALLYVSCVVLLIGSSLVIMDKRKEKKDENKEI